MAAMAFLERMRKIDVDLRNKLQIDEESLI